ncbi:hypothetical protein WL29_21370 [Burkholderia ubonensis]|uniref:Uncharacterized protein n=1 Tax=Burkholderia ubonensis TaxID=101571 RepID=A0A106QD59_9BURK|nr:hypothetical protein [Burkholderia ubonensis]KWA83919.1 hypothetical protein WL29_21370 [Burkholderia ubonensis]
MPGFFIEVVEPLTTSVAPVLIGALALHGMLKARTGWRRHMAKVAAWTGTAAVAYASSLLVGWCFADVFSALGALVAQALSSASSLAGVLAHASTQHGDAYVLAAVFALCIQPATNFWQYLTNPPSAIWWN